jgi:hypothetical protein
MEVKDGDVLLCPQCHLDLAQIKVRSDNDVILANSHGRILDPITNGEKDAVVDESGAYLEYFVNKGNRAYLAYICENNHYGYIVLQLDKNRVQIFRFPIVSLATLAKQEFSLFRFMDQG